mgnify:CR=1 FL=1
MAKRVILAVAGAGKTYHICHGLDENERNLIIAFTHENIRNIKKELTDAFGGIPPLTTVSTFDSFIYKNFILPYEHTIAEHFQRPSFKSYGITMKKPPKPTMEVDRSRYVPNPNYVKCEFLEHYITKGGQYYCDTMSELACKVKSRRVDLVKKAVARLGIFHDAIFVDEFQDFRGHDYDLLIRLAELFERVTFVGDYYQHSVSAVNNSGKPFRRGVTYDSFVCSLRELGFEVDQTSLQKSRRCSEEICNYVKRKLGIDIVSSGLNNGNVIWADGFAEDILKDDGIVKLVFKDASKRSFKAMNWSYSKGSTLDSACVILTENFEDMDDNAFVTDGIGPTTVNKLYVAMTRSRGDLYLIKNKTLKNLGY